MLTVHKLIFVEYFESVSTTILFSILRFFYLICMPNKCMIFEKSQICHRISIWMFQFTLNLLKIFNLVVDMELSPQMWTRLQTIVVFYCRLSLFNFKNLLFLTIIFRTEANQESVVSSMEFSWNVIL